MKKHLLYTLLGISLVSCSITSSSNSTSNNFVSSGSSYHTSISNNQSSTATSNETSSTSTSSGGVSSMISNSSPIIEEEQYVVYINLDGFGRYYYDEAVTRGVVPVLESIKNEGVVFKNLETLSPSITNPCQAMIISGASSSKTRNVYRYYDKKNNIVVQQARENDADTIYASTKRNGIKSATIHHFPAETEYSTSNKDALYIKTPFGVVSNYKSRFDQAIKLVKGQQFQNDSTLMTVSEIPHFISIYCDDLDALGHNESNYDTFTVATSEEGRINNVISRLAQIDIKLGEFINACKEAGIYDKTTFFLTTDHGMQGFGAETKLGALTSKYTTTKWPQLKEKLAEINDEFIFEYVAQNKSPASSSTAIGVGVGLQMPITFRHRVVPEDELQTIKAELEKEYYISKVLTRAELIKEGFWNGANVDLLVVPAERYHFHGRDNQYNSYAVRGQHDTISQQATNIYGAIWGANVKKLGEIDMECKNISFGSTMAAYLNIDLLSANAPVLEEIMDK